MEGKNQKAQSIGERATPYVPKEVALLQTELRKEKLQNKLWQEILRLSEEYTRVELRKKYGTK